MCRRNTNDKLVSRFLNDYQLNLLTLPGNRVRCGSIYIQEGRKLTAPGSLGDVVEPELSFPAPYREPRIADLCDEWSAAYSADVGIGLLSGFLAALGVAPLLNELKASVKASSARTMGFAFRDVSRESLTPTQLAVGLENHRLRQSSGWVQDGNRYFAVAAVVRSRSLSIRGHDEHQQSVDLGAGLTTFADADAKVTVERGHDHELMYQGEKGLAVAVELYEVLWDENGENPAFHTQSGPLKIQGLTADKQPDHAVVDEDSALISPVEVDSDRDQQSDGR
jgi:hypothetical protein